MMSKKTKILIVIDQMAEGGAARVTSLLLSGLVGLGYDIAIALDNVNARIFYSIPDSIKIITLPIKNNDNPGFKQIRLILATSRIIKQEKPNVVLAVTFFPFFYSYYAKIGLGIPVICYDHTSFGRNMGRFINWIRYSLYGKADKLVILTKKDERLLGDKFPRKEVVYNPLTYPIIRHCNIRQKTILCAGRVDSWDVKGFDRIINIWGTLSKKYPEWKLQIAGGGEPKKMDEVKQLLADAHVEDSTELLGQVYDMPSLYAKTSIFALPSRVEGFPMVLLEAMSQGCVCVSYEMGGAVYEIMNENSGYIVKDGSLEEFSNALEQLINAYPDYSDKQESGYVAAGRFTCDTFYNQWDRLIKDTIKLKK